MTSQITCWTMIHAAAAGSVSQRDAFARRYDQVIRAYLGARWRGSMLHNDVDDACQEVFVECFRQGGPLERVDREREGGFRPFLYGIVRNVARRFEARVQRDQSRRAEGDRPLRDQPAEDAALSRIFDRAWAQSMMRAAADEYTRRAESDGEEGRQLVELLRLRFQENVPVRAIAAQWGADPVKVHRLYAKARRRFKDALQDIVAFDMPDAPAEVVERECRSLLDSLS